MRWSWDACGVQSPPTGTVTFLFTDIEGSTRRWQDEPESMRALLVEHAEGWVIDGNYHSAMPDLVLAQADTAIWLRLPFLTVYRRLAWRTVSRSVVGAELWNGNRESLKQAFLTSDSMLWWGIKSWRPASRKTREALTTVPHHARVIVLRSPRQVARLVSLAARGDGGE